MSRITSLEIVIEDEMVHPEAVPNPTTTCNPSNIMKSHKEQVRQNKEQVRQNRDDDLTKKVPCVTRARRYLLVFYASSAYCMKMLFTGSISPIVDVLKEEYDVSLGAVGLLSSSIFLLGLIFSIPSGIILQYVSYEKMLFIAWIGLIVSILLFGLCESLLFGILLRGMAGMFSACTWLLMIGFAAQYFGNNSISVISAITICYTRSISFAGLTVQAYIYQKYQHWREIYFVMALMGIVILIAYGITLMTLKEDDVVDENDDDANIETSLQTYTHSKRLSVSLTPMDLRFDLFDADTKKNEPITAPGNAFTNYLNWANCAIAFAIYGLIDGVFGLWFIPYLMTKFGFDRVTASILVGVGPWSHGFGALLIGYLAAKYKKRKIFLYFGIVSMSSIFAIIYLKDVPDFVILAVIVLVGIGSGAYACLLFALTREYNARNHCEDSAAGLVTAFCIGSAFVSQNAIGVLLDYHRSSIRNDEESDYNTDDYQFAFSIVLPVCISVMGIATFILKETNAKALI
eukprot:333747_1